MLNEVNVGKPGTYSVDISKREWFGVSRARKGVIKGEAWLVVSYLNFLIGSLIILQGVIGDAWCGMLLFGTFRGGRGGGRELKRKIKRGGLR